MKRKPTTYRLGDTTGVLLTPNQRRQTIRWVNEVSEQMKPRWFGTLTTSPIHPNNRETEVRFIKAYKRYLGDLTTLKAVPGVVKAHKGHITAITSFGVPSANDCTSLHFHFVICSDRGSLRWRHLARFVEWEMGSIKTFAEYDPAKNGLHYLLANHYFMPSGSVRCYRPSKCRRNGCKLDHLRFNARNVFKTDDRVFSQGTQKGLRPSEEVARICEETRPLPIQKGKYAG